MANICLDCTARYATGLAACPQCGGGDRVDEHEQPVDVPAVRPEPDEPEEPAGM